MWAIFLQHTPVTVNEDVQWDDYIIINILVE